MNFTIKTAAFRLHKGYFIHFLFAFVQQKESPYLLILPLNKNIHPFQRMNVFIYCSPYNYIWHFYLPCFFLTVTHITQKIHLFIVIFFISKSIRGIHFSILTFQIVFLHKTIKICFKPVRKSFMSVITD